MRNTQFSTIYFWSPVRKEHLSIKGYYSEVCIVCKPVFSNQVSKGQLLCGCRWPLKPASHHTGHQLCFPGKGGSSFFVYLFVSLLGVYQTTVCLVWFGFLLQKIWILKIIYIFPKKPGQCLTPEAPLKAFLISKSKKPDQIRSSSVLSITLWNWLS